MADKKIVGIDLTSREIRMVQVSGSRASVTLEKFAIGPIPPGSMQGGRISDPGKLAEAIRELLKGNRFSAKKCMLGISGKYGVTRMITLPKMSMAQTRDAIMLQLNQYVPFPPHDALYDFKVMREIKEEGGAQNEILLSATRKSSVQPFINLLKRAGLTCIGIKLTTLSAFSIFEDQYKDSDQAVAFIDVRDNVTDIFFIAENDFRLSRSVEFGFNIIVDKARQKLGKTAEETKEHLFFNKVDLMETYRSAPDEEERKKKVYDEDLKDIRLGEDHAGAEQIFEGEEGETPEQLARDSVLRAMSTFVNELMRSVRYFESQQKRRSRVGKLIVFGNIGMLEGLNDYLAEQTGYDVVVIDKVPTVNVSLDPTEMNALRDHEPEIVTSLGLAVEAVRAKKIELNLLPRETMVRRKAYSGLKFGIIGLVALIAILATVYIQLNNDYVDINNEVERYDAMIRTVQPEYDKVQGIKTEIDTNKQRFGGLVKLSGAQIPWPIIMDELGRIMRDTVWVKTFGFDANGMTYEFEGFAWTTQEFQRFLVQIYESKVFLTVQLDDKSAENEPDTGTDQEGYTSQDRPRVGGMRSANGGPGNPGAGASFDEGSIRGNDGDKPQPRYKLPQGPSGWQSIEDFFRGEVWQIPILWSFKVSGTVNPEIIKAEDIFGPDVTKFFS